MLAEAGARWDDAVSVESWHLPPDEVTYDLIVAGLHYGMPRHRPIWTALFVPGFGVPRMSVEARVTAFIP